MKILCKQDGLGLTVFEVDVLIGGSEHDLLDREKQDQWLARLEDGDFDCVMLSPPCGTWSRANWANDNGPKPCRNRAHPWGIPHLRAGAQRRAAAGNEFVHFSIRAIVVAQSAKKKGHMVRCILEHPEDLGRIMPAGPSAPSATSCMTITTVITPPAKFEHDDYYRHAMISFDDYYRHMTPEGDDYYRHSTRLDDIVTVIIPAWMSLLICTDTVY